jgi:acyl-CoA thioester hydrolase
VSEQPSAGQIVDREHRLPVRVYYEDTDFTGVVYHGAYVRFFERGRSDYLRLTGVHHTELLNQADPGAFTVVRMEIDFRQPARIDDALLVCSAYEAVKGPRLFIRQKIVRGPDLICEAVVQAAYIGMDGRPRKPPPALMDPLRPYFSS